ncbi:MAG: hypothetical protein ABEH43_09535 [Flavobacteriales bacterium]
MHKYATYKLIYQLAEHLYNLFKLIRISSILSILFIVSLQTTKSQDKKDTSEKNKINEKIVTVGEWEPTIKESEKISSNPSIHDTVLPEPKLKYPTISRKITTHFDPEPISPARLRIKEPLDQLYRAHIKAGVGNYMTPYGEIAINNKRSKDLKYGAYYKHHSSNGGVKGTDHSDFSHNRIQLWGEKFFDEHSLSGSFNYKRNVLHYYGFDNNDDSSFSDTLSDNDIEQKFNLIEGNSKWKSHYTDSQRVNHELSLNYYNLTDNYDAAENNFRLNANLKRYVESEFVELDILADFNTYSKKLKDSIAIDTETISQDNLIIGASPYITTKGNKWQAELGLGLYSNNKLASNKALFHFYPRINAHYSFYDGILIPYIGLNGKLKRNNLRSLSNQNPFINTLDTLVNLRNTNLKHHLQVGIRGAFSSNATFNVNLSKKEYENFPLFENAFFNSNRFRVFYDNIGILDLSAQASYNIENKMDFKFEGHIFRYTMDKLREPWHMPQWRVSLTGSYDILNKLIVKTDIVSAGKRKAFKDTKDNIDPEANEVNLDPYVDFNLSFEYRYTDRLSAFLDFNNILSSRYQKWHQYEVQRFNVIGGVTYSLWE